MRESNGFVSGDVVNSLRSKISIAALVAANILLYQNCGDSFTVRDGLTSLASEADALPDDEPDPTNPGTSDPLLPSEPGGPGSLKTADKAVGDATTQKTLTWDLAREVDGAAMSGVQVSVSVIKFVPPDGSADVYFLSAPTITTTNRAMQVRAIRVWVNGQRNDFATTFTSVNRLVPMNQNLTLSNATMLHQLAGAANDSDRIALEYSLLWPDGVPLPTAPTPAPVLSGPALYLENCAGCHGALAASTKRGRTSEQIIAGFTSAPTMAYLAAKLTRPQIDAIANSLK